MGCWKSRENKINFTEEHYTILDGQFSDLSDLNNSELIEAVKIALDYLETLDWNSIQNTSFEIEALTRTRNAIDLLKSNAKYRETSQLIYDGITYTQNIAKLFAQLLVYYRLQIVRIYHRFESNMFTEMDAMKLEFFFIFIKFLEYMTDPYMRYECELCRTFDRFLIGHELKKYVHTDDEEYEFEDELKEALLNMENICYKYGKDVLLSSIYVTINNIESF